ncbi:large tegument protein-like protein [Marssonina coronariae]|uniref:Large tegument protein-like protein n=1 Tax=Diplocarpon coronariae TaxID=2795749 RepID=A0A218Z613_9HELO|nr:large tegument protein-like protein [Marssonina coronariae]
MSGGATRGTAQACGRGTKTTLRLAVSGKLPSSQPAPPPMRGETPAVAVADIADWRWQDPRPPRTDIIPSPTPTPTSLRKENKLEHAIRLPANAERRPAPDIAASATARGPRSQENSASLVGVGLNIWLCRCSRRMVLRPDGRGWTCGPEHEIGRICAHEEERAGDDRGPRGCFGGWNFERAGEESAVLEAEAIPDAWLGRGYGMSMPSPCLFILNCREFHRYAAEKAWHGSTAPTTIYPDRGPGQSNSQVKVGDTRYAFCDQLRIPLSLAHIVS